MAVGGQFTHTFLVKLVFFQELSQDLSSEILMQENTIK